MTVNMHDRALPYATPHAWPVSLIEALEHQRGIVEEIALLASQQASLIADRETDQLLQLLGRRQSLIEAFTSAQANLAPLTAPLDERLPDISNDERVRIRGLIADLAARLGTIMAQDDAAQKSLHRGRETIATEIAGIESGRQARAAYGTGGVARASTNVFADQKG